MYPLRYEISVTLPGVWIHRLTGWGGWKGPLWMIQTPLLEQDHLEQVPWDQVQVGVEYLQIRRPHGLSGQQF